MAVGRNEAEPRAQPLMRGRVADVGAFDLNGAVADRAQTHQRLHELVLAVALDAGHANNLAGSDLQADVIDGHVVAIVHDHQVLDGRTPLPGFAGFLSTRSKTGRPTIIRARSEGVASFGDVVATTWPRRITVMASAISITSASLWVMKITALPSEISARTTSKSPRISCGVSTAVGSSRISRRAPR